MTTISRILLCFAAGTLLADGGYNAGVGMVCLIWALYTCFNHEQR